VHAKKEHSGMAINALNRQNVNARREIYFMVKERDGTLDNVLDVNVKVVKKCVLNIALSQKTIARNRERNSLIRT